jgi:Phage integrase SAM-like domain
VRLSVGKEPADASARRLRKEAELNAPNNGVAVMPENGDSGHRSLAAAVAEFLDETKLTKKPKTVAAYTTALNYFTESCPKLYLEDIDRRDLLKFSAFLRDEKEQAPGIAAFCRTTRVGFGLFW